MTIHFPEAFPEEISLNILANLDARCLGRFCRVSRSANRLASDDKLWKMLFAELKTPSTEVKAHLYVFLSRAVWSNEELLKRVQKFADKIQGNQLGMLKCKFPYNPDYWITVGYDYASDFTNSNFGTKIGKIFRQSPSEEVYFMKPLPASPPGSSFDEIESKEFFVFSSGEVPSLPEFENHKLSKEMTRKVSQRLEYLESRSSRNRIFLTIGMIASSAFCLGLYFIRRK